MTKEEIIDLLKDNYIDPTEENIERLKTLANIFNCSLETAIKFFRKPWE